MKEFFFNDETCSEAIEVRIYPRLVDKNDNGEKTVSINKIESNIGDVLIKLFCDNKKI